MILKLMRKAVPGLCAVLCCMPLAQVRAASTPFTVLSNNADVANAKLYVEVMYEKSSCGDYKAQFRLVSKANPAGDVIPVDSFMNNPGTYETEQSGADKYKSLMRPTAGGYRLRFALPASASLSDSFRICVDAYKMAYRCVGCAAGGSDAIFGPDDIDNACPYKGDDVLACYRRESKEANWEAWIQDPRDCQPYRVVAMPDGRWWFAQNLNYQKDLTMYAASNNGPVVVPNTADAGFWCPGGKSFDGSKVSYAPSATPSNPSQQSGGVVSCKTYGALYSWTTGNSLNGRGAVSAQGICPSGWRMPTDLEWGGLLNAVEGCGNPSASSTIAPCNHVRSDMTIGYMGAPTSKATLKITSSCTPHSGKADSVCAKANNPLWNWRRLNYNEKMNTPLALANDRYGFSAVPAGYRLGNGENFDQAGVRASFWTAGQSGTSGLSRSLINIDKNPERGLYLKQHGMSVRCVGTVPINELYIFPYGNSNTLMLNTDASLLLTTNSGYTGYAWTITPTDGISYSNSSNTFSITNNRAASGGLTVGKTYVVTVTANDSEGNPHVASKTVEITALPPVELPTIGLAGIYVSPNTEVDKGAAVNLSAYSTVQPAGATYTWTAKNNTNPSEIWTLGTSSSAAFSTTSPNVSVNSRFTITVTVAAPGYKTATASVEYTVRYCAPVVQTTLRDTTVCPGEDVVINPGSATGGDGTYEYKWQTRGTYTLWENIAGANSASYSASTPATSSPAVYYRRIVTSCDVIYYSNEMKVSTYTVPTQTSISNQTVCPNTNVTLTSATPTGGSGNYTYLWESSPNGTTWSTATGTSNGLAYVFTAGPIGSTTYYRRTITSCGMQHTTASITVSTAGTITQTVITQRNICPSQSVTITLNAASGGNGSFTYAWQYNNTTATATNVGWTTFTSTGIIGAGASAVTVTAVNDNAITFTAPAVSSTYSPFFRRVVTSCEGAVSLNPAGVYGAYTTGGVSQPYFASQYACPGSSITINPGSATGGDGAYTYQWQTSPNNATWTDIPAASGGTNVGYTLTAPIAGQSSDFFRRIAYTCGGTSATSHTTAAMKVFAREDLWQPNFATSYTVCPNTIVTLSLATATGGSGSYTYIWQKSSDQVTWVDIDGATGLSYQATAPAEEKATLYYRRVAYSCDAALKHSSNAVSVSTLNSRGFYPGVLADQYNVSGNAVVNLLPEATTAPSNGSYQWQISADKESWVAITGATQANYAITAPLTNGAFSSYYRRSMSSCDATMLFTNATRIYTTIECPYKGSDLVAGTCRKREKWEAYGGIAQADVSKAGVENWEATIRDVRDENRYKIVQIGTQWWFAQNLYHMTGQLGTDYYCYNNDAAYCPTGGVLYSWSQAMSGASQEKAQGVCPVGWHIPSEAEYLQLRTTVSSNSTKLRSIDIGDAPTADNLTWQFYSAALAGTNAYGFSSIPTGRFEANAYAELGRYAFFYLSSRQPISNASSPGYPFKGYWAYSSTAMSYDANSYNGEARFSVRCVANDNFNISNSTAPTSIHSDFTTISSGFSITLTARGGVLGSNGIYQWGTGQIAGENIITDANAESIALTPTTSTTYWVRRVDNTTYTDVATITIIVGTCPYPGSDSVRGTCRMREAGLHNWEVQIQDARDGNVYRAVQLTNGQGWIFAERLRHVASASNAAAPCSGGRYQYRAENTPCPAGWILPTHLQYTAGFCGGNLRADLCGAYSDMTLAAYGYGNTCYPCCDAVYNATINYGMTYSSGASSGNTTSFIMDSGPANSAAARCWRSNEE